MIYSNRKYLQVMKKKKAAEQQRADAKNAELARLKALHDQGNPEFMKSAERMKPFRNVRKPIILNEGMKKM